MIARLLAFSALVMTAACASQSRSTGAVLVIAGGAVSPDGEVFTAFLNEVNAVGERSESGNSTVEIIPTASGDPLGSLEHNRFRLSQVATQAQIQGAVISADNANDLAIADRLRTAQGVWFTGGDQSRIIRAFRPELEAEYFEQEGLTSTAIDRAVRVQLRKGGVIGGTSAGAAIMSKRMIAGGRPSNAILHGVSEAGVRLTTGMDYLPFGIVDQHFFARGRIGRLLVALFHTGEKWGIGVDENSALLVRLGEPFIAEGVGMHGVCVVQLDHARSSQTDGVWHARIALLGHEDRWLPNEERFEPREGRVAAVLKSATPSELAPFDKNALLEALLRLSQTPGVPQVLEDEVCSLILSADGQTQFLVAPQQGRDLFASGVVLKITRK